MKKKKFVILGLLGALILILCIGLAMDTSDNITEEGLDKNHLYTSGGGITYSITINCSGVSNHIKIFGFDYIPQGEIQVFDLEEGIYSLFSFIIGHFALFEVNSNGVVSYDSSLEGSVLLGEGTSILALVGHSVIIDATQVDQEIALGAWFYPKFFLGWTEPGTTRTFSLVVNEQLKYGLWTYHTYEFASFNLRPTGIISYDNSQVGIIEGNKTSSVKIIGHPIMVDATDVDQQIGMGPWFYDWFLGWTEPGTTKTFNLVVNEQYKYGLWTYHTYEFASFNLRPTGIISYDITQVGRIEGNKTSSVKIIGHPITVDATDVDQQIGMGPWFYDWFLGWTEPGTTRTFNLVVNEQYKYSLWTYFTYEFASFNLRPTGTISYDISQVGRIEGNNTGSVKAIGHPITVDATDVDQQIGMGPWFYDWFLGWTEPGCTRTYNLVASDQYQFTLWAYYTSQFASFDVQPTGVITYDNSQIGIIEGNETNTVKPIGYPITIDATEFEQRVAIGAWFYPESFLGWIEPGDTRTINLAVNGLYNYGLWTNVTNIKQAEFTVFRNGTCNPNEFLTDYGIIYVNSDAIPPVTTINLNGSIGNNGWYISDVQVTFTATDDSSSIKKTEYSFDSTNWIEYIGSFVVTEESNTTIFYRSIDNVGNVELMKSNIIKIDKSRPDTQLDMNPYYIDDLGNIYITASTEFNLTGTDQPSGVEITYYRINGGNWITYSEEFTITENNSPYTIEYYSVDIAGNEELINSITVNLVNFEINTYLSKGEDNTITYFDVIFTKNKQTGEYRLVATNPGQIFYIIEFTNHWPTSVDTLDIEILIPVDFILKGSEPIHVYLDGTDITSDCVINGNLITIQDIPSDSVIKIVIHLDYGLKGNTYESLDDYGMKGYVFNTVVSGVNGDPLIIDDGLEQSSQYSATLITHQKKTTAITGYVYDIYGNPIEGATVELYLNGVLINTTITDENGFYYFIDVEVDIYEVHVIYNGITKIQVATASKDELTELDFMISYENP